MSVTEYLLDGKDPDREALVTLQGSHSYGELRSVSADVAEYLTSGGALNGDRALLISENSFFWVAAYLGILRAGLVCVPLPPTISQEEIDGILEVTEPKFAFLQHTVAGKHSARFGKTQIITERRPSTWSGYSDPATLDQIKGCAGIQDRSYMHPSTGDLAALMFTSGSTGKPNGVMVSHGNIIANTNSIIEYLQLTEADRMMTVLPFHYCFGTSLLHTHLKTGGALVLDSRFLYPEKILERMIETGCTGFAGVPSHFQILLRRSSIAKKAFPHLRYVQQAGGHLPPTFIQELRQALPEKQIFIMYGQTEATARLSYLPPSLIDTKSGSIGKGIPGVRLRVVDSTDREVGPGEAGEIVAEGENVALGYWRAPAETTVTFRDGKLHTGDIATVDEDGYIYIVDRAKDFVKIAGKRVSCRQLEDKLMECGEVLEAAVIGFPDEILGEAIKAFVVPRTPDNEGLKETLYLACKKTMPPEFVPKEIVLVQALPKNSAGKVLKQNLRAS